MEIPQALINKYELGIGLEEDEDEEDGEAKERDDEEGNAERDSKSDSGGPPKVRVQQLLRVSNKKLLFNNIFYRKLGLMYS